MLKGDCNKCLHGNEPEDSEVCVRCGIARKNYTPITAVGKYGDICDKCVHEEYCDIATFGGHYPKITACYKYAERQKMDERSERE
jgi:hypothetical protein